MPAKKMYVLSTTVRWSAFEVILFRYLNGLTGRSMANELRESIRFSAPQVKGFSPGGFLGFVRKEVLAKVPEGPDREKVLLEAERYAQRCERVATTEPIEPGETFEAPLQRGAFVSSPGDFDID